MFLDIVLFRFYLVFRPQANLLSANQEVCCFMFNTENIETQKEIAGIQYLMFLEKPNKEYRF